MIGVLLTSTCYFTGISKLQLQERCEDLAICITTLAEHIRQPYELIIADNSPVDMVPTEQLLTYCPDNTVFIRHTNNPGKHRGEALLVRDGVCLSNARGHDWLLKLSGRYHLIGDLILDETIAMLDDEKVDAYLSLTGDTMKNMPWAIDHPLYESHLESERILISAVTHVFLVRPSRLIDGGVFHNSFLFDTPKNITYEQAFWWAIKNLVVKHWKNPPVDGWIINRNTKQSVYERTVMTSNPVFEQEPDYQKIPHIDLTPLLQPDAS